MKKIILSTILSGVVAISAIVGYKLGNAAGEREAKLDMAKVNYVLRCGKDIFKDGQLVKAEPHNVLSRFAEKNGLEYSKGTGYSGFICKDLESEICNCSDSCIMKKLTKRLNSADCY